jgi:hypothetical protein
MPNSVTQFVGGSPLMVLVRLILLSILVGVILSAFGLDPTNIFPSLRRFMLGIWNMGWDAVTLMWGYFFLGAILVIPIWLIMRFMRSPSGR